MLYKSLLRFNKNNDWNISIYNFLLSWISWLYLRATSNHIQYKIAINLKLRFKNLCNPRQESLPFDWNISLWKKKKTALIYGNKLFQYLPLILISSMNGRSAFGILIFTKDSIIFPSPHSEAVCYCIGWMIIFIIMW